MKKLPRFWQKPICTPKTPNSQIPQTFAKPTLLICIGHGLNHLPHLHTAYTTILTPMMTATYKHSR